MTAPTTDDGDRPPGEPTGSGLDEQMAQRRAKVAALREAGTDAWAYRYEPTHTLAEVRATWGDIEAGDETGEDVRVAGRLVAKRGQGRLAFAVLREDGIDLQLFVQSNVVGEDGMAAFDDLDLGDWVGAEGEVLATRRGELSVRPTHLQLLGKAIRPLPDKWHGLKDVETRTRQRELDLVVNADARRVFDVRAKVLRALRDELARRDFVEVETPMLHPIPGGAAARPFVTHHNTLDTDLYLRIAPELYLKRLIVGGYRRVFEINRSFRNEGMSTRHNPEFTMLETYQAYGDMSDAIELVEALVAGAASAVRTASPSDGDGHGGGGDGRDGGDGGDGGDDRDGKGRVREDGPDGRVREDGGDGRVGGVGAQPAAGLRFAYGGREVDLQPPFEVATMLELVQAATQEPELDYAWSVERVREVCDRHDVGWHEAWGTGKLVVELFEALVEHQLWDPVFVTEHPVETSPLARRHRDPARPHVTERFELIVVGREHANAFSELVDPDDQRARFEAQAEARAAGDDEAMVVDEPYLRAMELGMPPTSGMGLGVDRLVMLLTDTPSIRDVILFPTLRPERVGHGGPTPAAVEATVRDASAPSDDHQREVSVEAPAPEADGADDTSGDGA